ncbi:MAG: NAD(P)H nitroreductase [Aeromonadaceae bacterium]|nr:NAD(P)H nitroreductase [Aeromonadaceae bacterium]
MDALSLLLHRQSIAQLQEPAPCGEVLERILQAGLRAPDHGALHPWQFLLAQGDGRQRLGELFAEVALAREMSPDVIEKARKAPLRAPLVITVVARIQPHDKVPPLEQQLSAGCAVMAMQMAAQAQGFGGIWRSGWFIFDRLIHQALGLHESDQIVGFLYLGTPATTPKPPRLLASDAFIRYL